MPEGGAPAKTGTQVPGIYRMSVGQFEVTALLDGFLDLRGESFTGSTPDELARLHDRNLLPPGELVRIPVNAYVVNTGEQVILIDAGCADTMGANLGRLPQNLAAAGIGVDRIDSILITHAHPDHLNGVTEAGKAVFPNAELVFSETEWGFWTAEETRSLGKGKRWEHVPERVAAACAPYQGRIRQVATGEFVCPGIASVLLPGHTPGHTGYLLDSDGEACLVWGDVVHVPAYQLEHPEWGFSFDVDSALASKTRAHTLDMVSTDRLMVAGMHLPFPGVGHLVRETDRYSFVPAPWAFEL